MARVFITGSADGLGLMAARLLIADGHAVTLHARSAERAAEVDAAGAEGVLVGDLSSVRATRDLAARANASGRFDAVIHNAGIGYREPRRVETADGLEHVFAVNVLAPYLLTALMEPPDRLVYLSSGMARGGDPELDDPQWTRTRRLDHVPGWPPRLLRRPHRRADLTAVTTVDRPMWTAGQAA
jgi:NAD(P)-dependent dehydrogenase (short-subunit alcohol dehydrogenase family)